jgi:hypothetical protein
MGVAKTVVFGTVNVYQKPPFLLQLVVGESPFCEERCLFQLQEELAFQGLLGDLAPVWQGLDSTS